MVLAIRNYFIAILAWHLYNLMPSLRSMESTCSCIEASRGRNIYMHVQLLAGTDQWTHPAGLWKCKHQCWRPHVAGGLYCEVRMVLCRPGRGQVGHHVQPCQFPGSTAGCYQSVPRMTSLTSGICTPSPSATVETSTRIELSCRQNVLCTNWRVSSSLWEWYISTKTDSCFQLQSANACSANSIRIHLWSLAAALIVAQNISLFTWSLFRLNSVD